MGCWAVSLGVFLLAAALFLGRQAARGGLDAIPGPGDDSDYDLLAIELAAGRGFRFDYDLPEWRATYENADREIYATALKRHGAAPTTYRPPGFPVMVAGLYSLFGRQFDVVRVTNCLLMAGAGGFIAWLVAARMGPLPGVLFGVLFALVEHRARFHAGQFSTESLATFAVCGLLVLMAQLPRGRAPLFVGAAGIVAVAAILTRPILVLWLPILVPLVAWLVKGTAARRIGLATLFAGVIVAGLAPWSVRNCRLLGEFAPLGTHGQQNLAAAYSDEALARGGIWFPLDEVGFFPAEWDDSQPGLHREERRAELSEEAGMAWIRAHPAGTARLMALHVWRMWQPTMHWDALILGLAFLGWCLWPDRREWGLLTGFLVANTLAVGVTWSVGGRFLVPLLPLINGLAACGLWGAMGLVWHQRQAGIATWLGGRERLQTDDT